MIYFYEHGFLVTLNKQGNISFSIDRLVCFDLETDQSDHAIFKDGFLCHGFTVFEYFQTMTMNF